MLSYSTSFNVDILRQVIASLHYISETFRSRSNVRNALVLYPVTGAYEPSYNSVCHFIYDTSGSNCSNAIKALDDLAGNKIGIGRSSSTASYKALEFLNKNVEFVSGKRTSIIAIQDDFSNDGERLKLISSAIHSIRNSSTADFIFLAAGVKAQQRPTTWEKAREELNALAEGKSNQTVYVTDGTQFTKSIIKLLVDNNILCQSDGMIAILSANTFL